MKRSTRSHDDDMVLRSATRISEGDAYYVTSEVDDETASKAVRRELAIHAMKEERQFPLVRLILVGTIKVRIRLFMTLSMALAPPIITSFELEKALIAVASGYISAMDASVTIGLPLRYGRRSWLRQATALKPENDI